MKTIKLGCMTLITAGLTACGVKDSIEDKVEEAKSAINSTLAEAERTAEGLLEDPELRDSAMTQLKTLIPDSLAVSSILASSGEDDSYMGKVARLDSVLSRASRETDPIKGIKGCLKALPRDINQMGSPLCYGPSLNYNPDNHPDNNGGQSMGGQLPGGDLGIWEATHGQGQACAAAKLNQLSRNAAVYADLGTGSLAMMICVSAFAGDTLPGPGNSLDIGPLLAKINSKADFGGEGIELSVAKVLNNEGVFEIDLEGTFHDKQFSVSTQHDPELNEGVISVISEEVHGGANQPNQQPQQPNDPNQQPQEPVNPAPLQAMGEPMMTNGCQPQEGGMGGWRVATLKYSREAGSTKYRMITSAQASEASAQAALQANGEASTHCDHFMGDLNVVQAHQDVDGGDMAFGWQAGSGDGFLRVFNATTEGSTGTAWFGYAPHEEEEISTLLTIDRMICNWAGVGNQRSGQPDLIQMQEMSRGSDGQWEPTQSKIHYAPTNSCDMDGVDQADVFPDITWDVSTNDLAPRSSYTFNVPQF